MQNIITRIFIIASLVFGVTGILIVLTANPDGAEGEPNIVLVKILFTAVFIILPSFALSVAYKYLGEKSDK